MLKCILFLTILAITSIGGDLLGFYKTRAQSPRVITLSEKDNGRKIRLKKGEILVLKLNAQFGTGYSWQAAAGNDKRLQLLSQSVENTGKNGESGFETQIFRFKAKQTGQFRLGLDYRRVWEKDAEPLKRFRLRIQISKS